MAGLPWLVLVLSCFGRGVGSDCVVCFICFCDFGINNDRRPLAVYRVLFMEMPHLMRRSFKQVSTVNHDLTMTITFPVKAKQSLMRVRMPIV